MTFGRSITEARERREAERQRNLEALAQPSKSLHRGTYQGALPGVEVHKENVVDSEAYHRLVAALPCCWCDKPGPSQCAHANHGKGMGIKTDSRRCFPLCPDCHREFDQGATVDRHLRRMLADVWGEATRQTIIAAGKWPAGLPRWSEA